MIHFDTNCLFWSSSIVSCRWYGSTKTCPISVNELARVSQKFIRMGTKVITLCLKRKKTRVFRMISTHFCNFAALRNSKWTLNVQRTGKVPEIFQVPEWDLLVIFVLDIHRKKPKQWKKLVLGFHTPQLWKSRLATHLGTCELHLGKIRLVTNWTILHP